MILAMIYLNSLWQCPYRFLFSCYLCFRKVIGLIYVYNSLGYIVAFLSVKASKWLNGEKGLAALAIRECRNTIALGYL